jgi:peptidoglycan/xylan/chitin deacetylase (PgdA/CDA1 family)
LNRNAGNKNPVVNRTLPANTALEAANTNTAEPTFAGTPNELSRIPTDANIVVFTFDAGSGDTSIKAILESLRTHDLIGSFFLTGRWVEQYPADVKAVSNDGHEIYNHTYSHPHLPVMTAADIQAELERTDQLIRDLTNKSTKPYFRPPYGDRNQQVLESAAAAGYQSIYWTVDALDWKESEGVTADQVRERVLSRLAPGAIYLFHVGDSITGAILDGLISEIEARGYVVMSLGQALAQE